MLMLLARKKSSVFKITSHQSPQQNERRNEAGDWAEGGSG